jgi:signal transduction histidine kinase
MTWSKNTCYPYILLFCLLSGSIQSVAQPAKQIDSLVGVLNALDSIPSTALDSNYFWTLSRVIEDMAYYGDDRVQQYLDLLIDYRAQYPNLLVTALLLRAQARVYDRSGQFDLALDHYLAAIDTFKLTRVDPGEIAMTYVTTAFLLSNSGSPDKCLEVLKEALPYAEASKKNALPLYYIFDYMADYNYYSSFGVEDFDAALDYYQKARSVLEKNRLNAKIVDNYAGLANVYYRHKNIEKGDYYWNLADSIALANQDYNYLYGLHIDRAEILLDEGNNEKAIEMVENSLRYAKRAGWPELIARAQSQLYQTYRTVGDFENALYAYEEYSTLQDSMNKQTLLKRYSELETKYENEKKEQLIIELNNRNLRQSRNFLAGIAALSILLLTLGVWTNLRLRKHNRLLSAKNKEILEAHIKGQTVERKRVASELHDNLNTKVAAIRWQLQALEAVEEPHARKIIDSTLKLVNDVYSDIRLISHNLMPEEIESIGLIPALDNLIGQLNTNNRVEFNLIANSDELVFPKNLIYPLYNISFELINNILKHSQARKAWISLTSLNNAVTITVSDDGKGFDTSEKVNGVGLKNIQSRVEGLGGTLRIDSQEDQGTRTIVRIPVGA